MSSLSLAAPGTVAVVEASAGTGKTHLLVTVVADLIAEGRFRLEDILVVTYTEKATAEFRYRLRKRLAEEAARDRPTKEAKALREAVDRFDGACIHTIHAFAHQALRLHAFENGQPFALGLANDPAIADRLFDRQLRTRWADEWLRELSPAER